MAGHRTRLTAALLLLLASICRAHRPNLGTPLTRPTVRQAACAGGVFRPLIEQTMGPFFFEAPERSQLAVGEKGVPLKLTLAVRDEECSPVPSVKVDLWSADADGLYSGIDEEGRQDDASGNRLRGYQVTDAGGLVTFETVIPAFYSERLPHMHFMIRYKNGSVSSQLYFPQAVVAEVVQLDPYAKRGSSPVDVQSDVVLGGDVDVLKALTLDVRKDRKNSTDRVSYSANFTAAIGLPGGAKLAYFEPEDGCS